MEKIRIREVGSGIRDVYPGSAILKAKIFKKIEANLLTGIVSRNEYFFEG
jgi:hypothetical protein